MATSPSCYTSPLHTGISSKHQSTLPPSTSFLTCFTRSVSRPVVVLAAANSIKVEKPAVAETPSNILPFRVGHGFDLHRLEPGYPLIIGGINIPHDRGCEAHSDGDVLLHCVLDAILGALGLPDIGQIFPDSDPKWKGAVAKLEGFRNLDATLILQRPKVSPHKEAIRANLSLLLGADPGVVNLKAKTHEKVDSLGENRSIAAHTVVLLMKK
ncbi:hypothetical protein L1987_02918 [Smallanthus sonchifolius]|uniref:Uncharacterized protein n=1 Tax=Smallanthus sonchifolius TaxID=185202 RepID=A0ACB9K9A0_9ASTR|nr:hypothetical protein L1987_02918 [Smallanthus sonchifolius]